MQDLIDVFRMTEVTSETRANLIIKLGVAINAQYGSNLTESIVCELVKLLCPNHPILSSKHYMRFMTTPEADE